ncbi:MAG: S-layer protein [Candidatus Methanofastidiosia archaeon]
MKIKKIGAVLLGAALLGATLCVVQADIYPPPNEFFINPDGTPACIITVGSNAAAMDVVSASMIAAKIGSMAVKVEEVQLPPKRYTVMHEDIPLYDWTGDGDLSDERLGYPVLDVPDAKDYNKWDKNPPVNPPINYTLTSLWWFDDYDTGLWGDQDGMFDPWETHEEIQYRFDNLAVFDPFSGTTVRDNLADLLGGDIDLWKSPLITMNSMFIPSLIYRADNIFVPPSLLCKQTKNHPGGIHVVDLDYELTIEYYVPDPYLVTINGLPKFTLFGKLYTVVDAGPVIDYNYRTGEYGPLRYTPYVVTGTPTYFFEQYLYKDQPEEYGDYTVLLKDVDVDHNKAWFEVTDPDGYVNSFWMVLDPEHGFSPGLQQQGWSGMPFIYNEPFVDENGNGEYDQGEPFTDLNGDREWTPDIYENKWIVGRAENDVWGDLQIEGYRDDVDDFWWLFSVPMFVIDGVKVFVGANGTTGIEVKVYTLQDKEVFYNHECCIPFVTEPNNYQLFLDAYEAGWDAVDEYNYYIYQPPGTGMWPIKGLCEWQNESPLTCQCTGCASSTGFVANGMFIGNGFLDNNDGHIGNEYYGLNAVTPGVAGPYFPEANDLDRDGSGPNTPIGMNDSDSKESQLVDLYTEMQNAGIDIPKPISMWRCTYPPLTITTTYSTYPDIEDPVVFSFVDPVTQDQEFIGYHCPGQRMVEINIALCDIVEMAECLTRFVFNGPNDYFRIEMDDITWDDDNDDDPDSPPPTTDDGLDWTTVMEIAAGTYTQVVQVDIDETELVKLDIEIDSLDKQNFNLILIGGPVANQLSKELEDLSIPPDDGSPVDWMYTSIEGDFKLYTDPYGTGKDVLMVAGADRDATRAAAEQLISKL